MAQEISLRQIERKAWTSYFDDGLFDILLGFVLLLPAVSDLFLDVLPSRLWEYGIYAILVGLACLAFWGGKRYITVPRLGRVEFGSWRRARRRKTAVILAIQIIAGMIVMGVLVVTLGRPSLAGPTFARRALLSAAVGLWVMVGVGLVSYFMDFTRGYLIAVFYAVGFGGAELLGNAMMFVLAAAVTIAMGLVVFVRFLREYPVPEEGPSSERSRDGNR
jgi:MFS family permease